MPQTTELSTNRSDLLLISPTQFNDQLFSKVSVSPQFLKKVNDRIGKSWCLKSLEIEIKSSSFKQIAR